ncbi:TRAP transporter small permease [Gilvimarinus agarilyticus]|uniref:TRAP transporter small permease n=1 Tax=Gilvimarinus sp. 2_MG-2023 TaxID=3062666 RepID=UPI001C080CF5|nr:TRAP transporter small permease [Gilvimarinus sp. 2_MG-2023]MBU2886711.1 TRAP transporter small permease [Gilvimarinus agarilyticus]MDO6571377.1 TRAP transporter small permease [Gilvimarinus sp. 2_MG-2023]
MPFSKICNRIDYFLEVFTSILMVGLVLDVTWQVMTRFFTSDPSSFTEELARFFLIWIAFLGAAHAFRKGAHLGLDYFVEKFSDKVKGKIINLVLLFVVVFSVCILIIGGSLLSYLAWDLEQTSASLGVSISFVYLAIPISGLLFVLFTVEFFKNYSNKI